MIIVDENYERSSSSVEDEAMPTISTNPTLLSPISNNEVKRKSSELPSHPSSPVYSDPMKCTKTEIPINDNNFEKKSLLVKIDLNRLNLFTIPVLRKYIEDTRPWELEPKKESLDKTKKENIEKTGDCETDFKVKSTKDSDNETKRTLPLKFEQEHSDRKHKLKKRKRRNSSSSVSSHSTVSNLSHNSHKKEHQIKKDKDNPKSKRRREDTEVIRSQIDNLNLINAPPTNHEREASKTVQYSEAVLPSSHTQPSREYHSYFEPTEEPSEYEER